MANSIGIPKRIGHIWIGSRKPPVAWMASWKQHHPDWDYVLYDNDVLTSRRWQNQPLIAEYFKRRDYAGVSDLMRYELLYKHGGFIPEADSICLRPCDALFDRSCAYTVYENETRKPGLCSPILACNKNNLFVWSLINQIQEQYTPETLKDAWISVGNRFMRFMIGKLDPDITVFPSHYFIPQHKKFPRYTGDGPVYADQKWGSTYNVYERYDPETEQALHDTTLEKIRSWLT